MGTFDIENGCYEYEPEWDKGLHYTNKGELIELNNLGNSHLDNLIIWGKNRGYNTYHLELEKRIRNLENNLITN